MREESRSLRCCVLISNVRIDASRGRKRDGSESSQEWNRHCRISEMPRELILENAFLLARFMAPKFQCCRSRRLADAKYARTHRVRCCARREYAWCTCPFNLSHVKNSHAISSRYFPFSSLSSFFSVFASRFSFLPVVSALRANCTREQRRMWCGFEKSEIKRPRVK
jgi:hypothetical protein